MTGTGYPPLPPLAYPCSSLWPRAAVASPTPRTNMHTSASLAIPTNAILNLCRQILEELDVKYSYPAQVSRSTLLDHDEAAVKPTSEPCEPSTFIVTVDEACAHPEAKHSVHHGLAGPINVVEAKGETFYIPIDAAVLEPKAVCSNALEPSAAPEAAASTAAALGLEPPCAAACPAVMTPTSYAAVAKASVVTAAPPQPAAAPMSSAAASMPSSDLKSSTAAFQLAADATAEAEAPSRTNEFVAKVVANVDTNSKSEQVAA